MGFVSRELERLSRALDGSVGNPRYPELYAAQQALAWALEPASAIAPYTYLTDMAAAAEGCSAVCHQGRLSDALSPTPLPEHSEPTR